MSRGDNVVIVKRSDSKRHAAHHGGAWKVAYADFVTAMMAFFLVMWIVGQSQEMRASVASYFRDPVAVQQSGGGSGVLPGARRGATGEMQEAAPTVERANRVLEQAAQHLRDKLSAIPEFDKIKDRIEIKVTPEGLQIEMLDSAKEGFFDSGSATLKPETVVLLTAIAPELAGLGHPVVIDGHTDTAPYAATNGYTNWELSADRANAARRVLQVGGIKPNQLEAVRGYADTKLRLPDKPLDAQNRRISILVRR
jgi:chemotaxis protein MotB